jgi:hypothetical protein
VKQFTQGGFRAGLSEFVPRRQRVIPALHVKNRTGCPSSASDQAVSSEKAAFWLTWVSRVEELKKRIGAPGAESPAKRKTLSEIAFNL